MSQSLSQGIIPSGQVVNVSGNSLKIYDGTDTLAVNADGSINVSGGGGVQVPSATQTIKFVDEVAMDGTNKAVATITAGKTAYVIALFADGTAADRITLVNSAATTNLRSVRIAANLSGSIVAGGAPIATYAAGESIKVFGAATTKVSIVYVEV